MSVGDLLCAVYPPAVFIVPKIIPVGLTYIAGRPKVGKSILALQLAQAKAVGRPFLGIDVLPGKVLYIDFENGRVRLQKRCRGLAVPADAQLEFQFDWLPLDKGGIQKLEEEIRSHKWDIVIIDTFSRALSEADQNNLEEMSRIAGQLQRLALRYRMSIILIDHQRKQSGSDRSERNAETDPIDDLLGSTGKAAPADAIVALYKRKSEKQRILEVVSRDEEEVCLPLLWDENTQAWALAEPGGAQPPRKTRKEQVFDAALELISENEIPTTTSIAVKLACQASNVSLEIRQLVTEGKLFAGEKRGRDVPYLPSCPFRPTSGNNNNNDGTEGGMQ